MSQDEWRACGAERQKVATRRDVQVARLAAAQHGLVTTRQLNACGFDGGAIRVRVARGQLHPLLRGVYAVGHAALTPTAAFAAAVLACGPGAVLSHRAATAHLGLLAWDEREPEVTVPRSGGRGIVGIRVHRNRLDPRDIWTRDGIRVTCPARTILDVAATMPAKQLRRMARQAQAEQRVNVRQLVDILERHPRRRGAAKLRRVIADGPAPTRSDHEDLVLDLIDRADLARPELNPKLHLDGRDIFPDTLWRDERLVIECDGRRWHDDPLTRQNDADKQAILEAHGYRVLRITWQQVVDHPAQTLARIRAALGDSQTA
jgi:predicted transcriptional regulator of viral defense system